MPQFLLLKHLKTKFKLYLAFFFLVFFINTNAYCNELFVISGNKNIKSTTIINYASKKISTLDPFLINNFQKKLFETGFFEFVNIQVKNKKIYVDLKEYPLVNFFFIEGIKNKNLLDKIYNVITVKENEIFRPYLIKNDIKNINILLNSLGYLKSNFDYELIKIENNKVNLFYKIKTNKKFKINRIYFIGNKYFKSSTLSDVIYSAEHGWWKFLATNTIPSESIINVDISRLKDFYLNNGFYDVQISSNSVSLKNDSSADIVYSINSGKKYYIKDIKVLDNSNSLTNKDLSNLNNIYKKSLNNLYNKNNISKLYKHTENFFLKSNYNLKIDYQLMKLNDNNLSLTFAFSDILNKKIINKIIFKGNSITDDFVLRNKLLINEGDLLNTSKIKESVEILKGTSLFKEVNYEILKKPYENFDTGVDVLIKIEEQPTGEISAGAGGGTNGFGVSGSINEKNFLGKGLVLNTSLNATTQKILGNFSYENSDFMGTGNTFKNTFFAASNKFENAGYENKIIGSSASLTYEIYDKLFFNPGVSIDQDKVSAKNDASAAIKRKEGDFFTSKFFYNAFKDTKNRQFQPTEGYSIGFGQGFSILSDIPYINNKFYGSYYNEYTDNFIGSVRYKLESINGLDKDVKFSDRLFVGSRNLRGFSDKGIGPKINNDFVGGNYSFYSTFSSTFPNGLPDKWNANTNVFLDAANVWGADDNTIKDSNSIRSSLGLGLSWVSPIGPLSFTYAQPLSKNSSDEVEQFNFSIGSAF